MKSLITISFCLLTNILFSKDKGIGLLVVSTEVKGQVQVTIYDRKDVSGNVVGSFLCQNTGEGQAGYKIQSSGRGLKSDNLIEFGYELSGLPVNKVDDAWLEVIYGFDDSGKALTGWVEKQEKVCSYFLWKDFLMEKPLFFEDPAAISFFNRPDGRKIPFRLKGGRNAGYDYIMKPLEQEGAWMKVQVTTPGDYCSDPVTKDIRILWIRYLDDKGRPLVWYFTRGC